MIKKLRGKFILINMTLVLAVLLIVFSVLAITYHRRTVSGSCYFLDGELKRTMQDSSQPWKEIRFRGSRGEMDPGGDGEMPGGPGELDPGGPGEADQGGPGAGGMDPGGPDGDGDSFFQSAVSVLTGAPRGNRGSYMPYVVFHTDADGNLLETIERNLTLDEESTNALIPTILSRSAELSGESEAGGSDKTAGNNGSGGSDKTTGAGGTADSGRSGVSSKKDRSVRGVLRNYDLRYELKQDEDGSCWIIFGDISELNSSLRSFLFSLGGMFLLAALLFFILSFWLARWALAPVEQAWDQQNRFVADASHELKTPITVILANLDIIRSHKDDTVGSQGRWIRNTRQEAERMRELIENLLFLARNDANALPVVMNSVDLSDLAEDRILNFEAVAFEKGVTVESEVPEGLKILGNEGQMKQLMTILLDNAVKYAGPDGRVSVTLSGSQDSVQIKVNNTGEPIAQEDLEHIFERFYRTDKSRARSEGGYGLGLSIADSIVRHHKGRIVCTSSREAGTTFTVTLPAGKEKA